MDGAVVLKTVVYQWIEHTFVINSGDENSLANPKKFGTTSILFCIYYRYYQRLIFAQIQVIPVLILSALQSLYKMKLIQCK